MSIYIYASAGKGHIGMYFDGGGHIAVEESLAVQTTVLTQNRYLNPTLWTCPAPTAIFTNDGAPPKRIVRVGLCDTIVDAPAPTFDGPTVVLTEDTSVVVESPPLDDATRRSVSPTCVG